MDKAAEIPVIFYNWETEQTLFTKDMPKYSIDLLANGAFATLYVGNDENEAYPDYVKKHVVFLDTELGRILTQEEISAVILHEIGHISCKHFLDFDAWVAAGKPLMSTTAAQEMEADAYAVTMGANPELLVSAIRKLADLHARRTIGKKGIAGYFLRKVHLIRRFTSHELTTRFSALRACAA